MQPRNCSLPNMSCCNLPLTFFHQNMECLPKSYSPQYWCYKRLHFLYHHYTLHLRSFSHSQECFDQGLQNHAQEGNDRRCGCYRVYKSCWSHMNPSHHTEANSEKMTSSDSAKVKSPFLIRYVFSYTFKQKGLSRHCCHEEAFSGVGGSRTLVRTRKPYAFYTLIPDFIFVLRQDLDHQPEPYPLNFHQYIEACTDYFRFSCAAGSSDSEQHLWGDVPFLYLVKELSSWSTVLRSSSESILVVAN